VIVRFYCPDRPEVDVEYDFGDARVPVVGEFVRADGTDLDFPEGLYRVADYSEPVTWEVGLRGPRRVRVLLSRDPVPSQA
jgi:hypothetical protein